MSEHKEAVRKLFKKLDKTGDELLSAKEVKAFLDQQNKLNGLGECTQAEIAEYVVNLDKDGDRTLSFEEFYVQFAKRDKKDLTEADYKKMFDQYDTNKDGTISEDEYLHILAAKGYDKDKAQKELPKLDLNKDGRLDFKEFMAMMNKK